MSEDTDEREERQALMGGRFRSRADDDTDEPDTDESTDGEPDESETDETPDTSVSSETHEASKTHDASETDDETPVRERKQVGMYLPKPLYDELKTRYNRYDGTAKLAGEDGIEKNDQFYAGIVKAGLEHPKLDEFVGISLDRDSDE